MSITTIKRILFIIGTGCLIIAAILSYKIIVDIKTKPPPRPREITQIEIQGWMTVPYIAKTYHYPPDKLFAALKLDPAANSTTNLQTIAQNRQITMNELSNEIQTLLSKPPHP